MASHLQQAAIVLSTVLVGVPCWLGVASAGSVSHDRVVSENPANVTPNVVSDTVVPQPAVFALGKRGDTIYAGGSFRTVSDATGAATVQRDNLVAFNATSGAISAFAPVFNGEVWAIASWKSALFVGGTFSSVNGVARQGLVKLNANTGQVVAEFAPGFSGGQVTEIRIVNGRLIVGGSFPGELLALNRRTGADTGYIDLSISGKVADNAGATKVYRFAASSSGKRLVAIGNFTSVAGHERWRAFMLNLGRDGARLNPWSYAPLKRACAASTIPEYLKDVDFAPDGSYFVIVSSGALVQAGGLGTDLCDAAARFETSVQQPSEPTWINYTGGDTLHSVAVTGAAVYVQGHQRWLDNPEGKNDAGPGAVPREGIGAIDPELGTALPWNPGKTRGVGGRDLLVTQAGLWVGSDGEWFNGERRARIAFCPL